MSTTIRELAALVGGRLLGDGDVRICGAAIIRDARPGEITLANDAKLAEQLGKSKASAAVVPYNFPETDLPRIIVADVQKSFAKIVTHFRPPRARQHVGVSPAASIAASAKLGQGVSIYPGVTIGEDVIVGSGSTIHTGCQIMAGCVIGQDVTIFPNVVLYEDTVVGDRCILHANSVIGAYGFGYQTVDGKHHMCAQLGYVEMGNDVEVGACSTIDRGTYGPTVIGEGTKLDNQVQIAHNCRIGRHNLLCSQVGIAGSCTTGDYVVMAGQVGVADHNNIGHHVMLGAQTGVIKDIADGDKQLGFPSSPIRDCMNQIAALARLPEMRKEFKQLQRTVAALACQIERSNKKDAA